MKRVLLGLLKNKVLNYILFLGEGLCGAQQKQISPQSNLCAFFKLKTKTVYAVNLFIKA